MDENSLELKFSTAAEVKFFSRCFLKAHPLESQCEFQDEEAYNDFLSRRQTMLTAQLDQFRNIDFSRPNVQSVKEKYYKIVPKRYTEPLSSIGSMKKSSRFNYKDEDVLKNKVVYFGKTLACCEIEKFHLEYQVEMMRKYQNEAEHDELDIDFTHIEENLVYEYDVEVDKILVLTTKPSCDAISVNIGTYRNEWFELNDEFEIPSSSQILGALAKAQGYNGIMYTSVRMQTTPNLVIFEENAGKLAYNEISQKEYKFSNKW